MNAHDDFLDLESAWREYDRAYTLWGQAVDGQEPDFKPAPAATRIRRGTRLARAMQRLHKAAKHALENHAERGWVKGVPGLPCVACGCGVNDGRELGDGSACRACPCHAAVTVRS